MSELADRFAALPAARPEQQLQLCAGSARDYAALAEHHYRAQRPATLCRVLRLQHSGRTLVGRYLQRSQPPQVVAVLVESLPALHCKLRDQALDQRFGGIRHHRQRAALLNQELRCISRVVVHPQWRGLGLAVRLVREALASATTLYTEALAAMGKVHPFFEQAGMTAYHRPPHPFDDRLLAALQACSLAATDLALLDATLLRIERELEPSRRDWLKREIVRWYRQTFGRSSQHSTDLRRQLQAARQRLLCQPVYYLHDNRKELR